MNIGKNFINLKSFRMLSVIVPCYNEEGNIPLILNRFREVLKERPYFEVLLVDNGSTIVLGGIYSFTKQENHSGIPFLKDLPLVGWFFRSLYNPKTEKSEMKVK